VEGTVAFTPVNFFQLSSDCRQLAKRGIPFALTSKNFKRYTLPDTSALLDEYPFAAVAMGWHREGLEFYIAVDQPYQESFFPHLERGDSIELCIDTRNVKTSGYNTRFCHHFFCLPEQVDGRQAGELTRFRTEDTHPLCDGAELQVAFQRHKEGYHLQIFIPANCLHGYDPDQYRGLGFTYRINRAKGASQHFSVSSTDFQFEQQPSLWSSLQLIQ
jgi:hypothetical protein